MDYSKKKGWNRDVLTQRLGNGSASMETKDLTDAEFYLQVGRIVESRINQGLDIQEYFDRTDMALKECQLSFLFALSSAELIFRALVEDWDWRTIKAEVAKAKSVHGGR